MLTRAAIVLLALLAGGAVHAEALPLASCAAPQHSIEAKRYELQGTTTLALDVDADGKAANVKVAASSGWKLLDADALKLAASCRFTGPAQNATLEVPWMLAPGVAAPQRPVLAPDGCRASELFKPVAAGTLTANMLVRLQVWADGQVYAPKIDTGSGDARIDAVALALVQSCRYAPAQRDGVAVQSSAVMHLAFDRAKLEEPGLRADYQRYLPTMLRNAAGRKEYRIAHILVMTEAAARDALAKLLAGESFAQLASRVSVDRRGKDGGDLGWGYPEYYMPAFAAALRGAAAPGLLPDVIKTEFGWHIIRVDAIRPGEPPPFEQIREALWKAALAERDLDKN